jgi:hypothetical protein
MERISSVLKYAQKVASVYKEVDKVKLAVSDEYFLP